MRVEIWSSRAVHELMELARQDVRTAGRIQRAVTQYSRDGTGDVKKLSGGDADWRPRAGDWRVLFEVRTDGSILVKRVSNRRDGYD